MPAQGPYPTSSTGTTKVAGYERDRPLWKDIHHQDSRVFVERVAQTSLRHPYYRAEMGGIDIARRLALYYYRVHCRRNGQHDVHNAGYKRRLRAVDRLRECWDGSVFSQCAERRFLKAMVFKTEALIPDYVKPGEWAAFDKARQLYLGEKTTDVVIYRDREWVKTGPHQLFILYHEYAEEMARRTRRQPTAPRPAYIPKDYWDSSLPAVKFKRNTRQDRYAVFPFMLSNDTQNLASASLDPAPALDKDPCQGPGPIQEAPQGSTEELAHALTGRAGRFTSRIPAIPEPDKRQGSQGR